jgi:hypothetical protein
MPGTIVVRPTNGLCNRLRVVSSFSALARRCNRELRVCWTAGRGWSDEDLEDLFENQFARFSADDFEQACADGLCLHDEVTVAGVGGLSEAWKYADRLGLAAVFDTSSHPVVTYWGFRPCQDLLAPEDRRRVLPGFDRDFEAELRAWRPVRAIRERVAELAGAFSEETVGVHVRRGDAFRHPRLAEQFRRSSDTAFMARMDRIAQSRPNSSFFLATDCFDTQQRFQDRYGSLILTNPEKRFVPSIPGAPKANQHDAVVDLFALARTRTILGNYYSTFSRTAAALGGARLKVVVADSWLAQLRRMATYRRNEFVRRARARARRLLRAYDRGSAFPRRPPTKPYGPL